MSTRRTVRLLLTDKQAQALRAMALTGFEDIDRETGVDPVDRRALKKLEDGIEAAFRWRFSYRGTDREPGRAKCEPDPTGPNH